MSAVRSLARAGVIVAVVGVAVLIAPGPASAHAALLSTVPAEGSVVTTVTTEVTLTFNEPVRAEFSTVAVTGPDGRAYSNGDLSVLDNVVHQPVHPLRSGDYEVAWRVVSVDGHPVSGTFAFSVMLPAGQEPAEPPAPTPMAAPAEGGWSTWWWAPAAAALAVVALLLLRAGRRRRVP